MQKRGLSEISLEKVELLHDEDKVLDENKISSSTNRRHLLGTFLKPLNIAGKFPRPFVIGLTGGSASGKSKAAVFLEQNGCEVRKYK